MPGSVMAMAVMSSPAQMPGSQRPFCSSSRGEEVGQADVVVEGQAEPGGVDPPRWTSSRDDQVVAEVLDPAPAVLLGTSMPRKPLAPALANTSRA